MLSKTTMQNSTSRCRGHKKVSCTSIEFVPDELLFDILVRLPADYLHNRARLVCRRWRRIIRSNAFINTHFQQHSTYGLVLSSRRQRCHSIYVTVTRRGRIVKSSKLNDIRRGRIMASCNGLAISLPHAKGNGNALSLHVINPLTKKSFLLPSVSLPERSHVYCDRCGIGYSAASMEYKVTLPYSVDHGHGHVQYCLDIVSVGVDKPWRRVEIPQFLPEHVSKLVVKDPLSSEGGFLHWGGGIYCLTMNVESEMITMSKVPLPQLPNELKYYYLSTGRYLSMLVGYGGLSWEIWEMRPSESGEWRTVLPRIKLEARECRLAIRSNIRHLFPLGWVKYPEVIAFSGSEQTNCIFYNLETHEIMGSIKLPCQPGSDYRAFVHRNSIARMVK